MLFIHLDCVGVRCVGDSFIHRDVCLLLNIMTLDGTLLVVLKEPPPPQKKKFQRSTELLKIINRLVVSSFM